MEETKFRYQEEEPAILRLRELIVNLHNENLRLSYLQSDRIDALKNLFDASEIRVQHIEEYRKKMLEIDVRVDAIVAELVSRTEKSEQKIKDIYLILFGILSIIFSFFAWKIIGKELLVVAGVGLFGSFFAMFAGRFSNRVPFLKDMVKK